MEGPRGCILVSLCRGFMLDDAGSQAACNHLTIAPLPDLLTWSPRATGLLHPLSEVACRNAKTQGDSLGSWSLRSWRCPGPLGDDALYGLAALFLLRILPRAPPDEPRAVRRASLLGTLPAWLTRPRSTPGHHPPKASVPTPGRTRAAQQCS